MTNPNIDTRDAATALAEFYAAPTATAADRATWTRHDMQLHREQRRDHFQRHAGHVAAALESLLAQLQLAQPVADPDPLAEAHRRYDGDTITDENTGDPTSHDDWGYAECQRRAFVAGAEWARAAAAPVEASTTQEALTT